MEDKNISKEILALFHEHISSQPENEYLVTLQNIIGDAGMSGRERAASLLGNILSTATCPDKEYAQEALNGLRQEVDGLEAVTSILYTDERGNPELNLPKDMPEFSAQGKLDQMEIEHIRAIITFLIGEPPLEPTPNSNPPPDAPTNVSGPSA